MFLQSQQNSNMGGTPGAVSYTHLEDRIALLDSGTIYGYSQTGEETGSWDAGGDAQKIVLYSRDSAYVLGISQIRQVSLS